MRIAIVSLICAGVLAGCGPGPGIGYVDVAKVPVDVARADLVQVLPAAPEGATIVAALDATSCKNKFWDADPTEANALEQLKIKAARLGATAIVGVAYSPAGTSVITNCWSSITATGTAITTP